MYCTLSLATSSAGPPSFSARLCLPRRSSRSSLSTSRVRFLHLTSVPPSYSLSPIDLALGLLAPRFCVSLLRSLASLPSFTSSFSSLFDSRPCAGGPSSLEHLLPPRPESHPGHYPRHTRPRHPIFSALPLLAKE